MEKFSGVPVWHASVAIIPLKPVAQWTPRERLDAEALLRSAVRGVGRDQELKETTRLTLQLRRLATVEEAVLLGGTQDRRLT